MGSSGRIFCDCETSWRLVKEPLPHCTRIYWQEFKQHSSPWEQTSTRRALIHIGCRIHENRSVFFFFFLALIEAEAAKHSDHWRTPHTDSSVFLFKMCFFLLDTCRHLALSKIILFILFYFFTQDISEKPKIYTGIFIQAWVWKCTTQAELGSKRNKIYLLEHSWNRTTLWQKDRKIRLRF